MILAELCTLSYVKEASVADFSPWDFQVFSLRTFFRIGKTTTTSLKRITLTSSGEWN